jgi:hypothetical protein
MQFNTKFLGYNAAQSRQGSWALIHFYTHSPCFDRILDKAPLRPTSQGINHLTTTTLLPNFLFSAVCTTWGPQAYRYCQNSQFYLPTTSHNQHCDHATRYDITYHSRSSSRLCDFHRIAVFLSPAPTYAERHHQMDKSRSIVAPGWLCFDC